MDEGQILDGKYRLGRLLGEGSLGRVYEAQHTSLARTVALKLFHGELMAIAGGAPRFLADARAARKVRHRNVVEVHEFGQLDEFTVYVAMERVEGCTLQAHLERHRQLGWIHARAIAQQVVAALEAAHRRRVLHRGLKATNCFVIHEDPPAQEPWIKVGDFAIVRTGAAKLDPTADQTSVFLGDPAYAAPELGGKSEPSVQSDVYAVGVLLYRMLTGVLPFTGDTPFHVLLAHAEAPVPSARDQVESIPPQLDAIIQRALAKDPSERYESVRELEQALDEVPELAEPPPEPTTDSPGADPAGPRPGKGQAHDDDAPGRPLEELETGLHRHAKAEPARPARDEAMHAAFERRQEDDEPSTSRFAPPRLFSYYGPAAQPIGLEPRTPASPAAESSPRVRAGPEPVRPASIQRGPVRPGIVPPASARSPFAAPRSASAPPPPTPPALVPAPISSELNHPRTSAPAPSLPESTVCLDAAGRASSSREVTGTVLLGAMERSPSLPEATVALVASGLAPTGPEVSPASNEPVARIDSTERLRPSDRVPEAPSTERVHPMRDAGASDPGFERALVDPGVPGPLAGPSPAPLPQGSVMQMPNASSLPTIVRPLQVRSPVRAASITSAPTLGQLVALVVAMLAVGALVVVGLVCTARASTVGDGRRDEGPAAVERGSAQDPADPFHGPIDPWIHRSAQPRASGDSAMSIIAPYEL